MLPVCVGSDGRHEGISVCVICEGSYETCSKASRVQLRQRLQKFLLSSERVGQRCEVKSHDTKPSPILVPRTTSSKG